MNQIDDMVAALECRQPPVAVPVWELEFHLWDTFSGKHLVLGQEFGELSVAAQERALHDNAEIILSISQQLGFAAISTPTPPWEQAPGVPAYYILPRSAFHTVGNIEAPGRRRDHVRRTRYRSPGSQLQRGVLYSAIPVA